MKRFCICLMLVFVVATPISAFAGDVVISPEEGYLEIMTPDIVVVLYPAEKEDGTPAFEKEGWEEFKSELTPQQQTDVIHMLMQLENMEAACDEEKSEI